MFPSWYEYPSDLEIAGFKIAEDTFDVIFGYCLYSEELGAPKLGYDSNNFVKNL